MTSGLPTTSPAVITPDPTIHTRSPTNPANPNAPSSTASIRALIMKFPFQIIDIIIHAIIGDLESLPIIGPFLKPFLDPISNIFANLFSIFGITDPLGTLGGSPGSFDVTGFLGNWVNILLLPLNLFLPGVDFGNLLNNIVDAISGDPSGTAVGSTITDIYTALTKVPIIGSFIAGIIPINVVSLFGSIADGLLSHIGIGALSNATPNLLTAPTFINAASIQAGTDWAFDSSVTQASDGSGSVKATANGNVHALHSNIINVAENQKLNLTVWSQWSNLSASGSPIQMGIVTYNSGVETGTQILASVSAPSPSSSWTQLVPTADYTVPSGVDGIAMRLIVDSTATAGQVWFDSANVHQTGQIQQDWVDGLLGQFNGILKIFGLGALGDLIDPVVSTVWHGVASLFLVPLNIFAQLFGGLLSGLNIPGLDASKIVSGVMGAAQSGLSAVFDIFSGNFGGVVTDVENAWTNLLSIFGISGAGILSGDPGGFDVGGIVTHFAQFILAPLMIPLQIFASLTGGLLSGSVIPGLDASKIVSGVFSPAITGFDQIISTITSALGAGGSTIASLASALLSIPGSLITGLINPTVSGAAAVTTAAWMGLAGSVATAPVTNTDLTTAAATIQVLSNSALIAAAAAQAALAAINARDNANLGNGGSYTTVTVSGNDGDALPLASFTATIPTGGLVLRAIGGSPGGGRDKGGGGTTTATANFIGIAAAQPAGTYAATLAHPFTTDDQSMIVVLGDQGQVPAPSTYMFTHCDSALTAGVYCKLGTVDVFNHINTVQVGSFTRSGSTFTFTPFTGGGAFHGLGAGTRIELRNQGTTWTVVVDDEPIVTCINSSVTFDSSHRTAGIAMQRQFSNAYTIYPAGLYDSSRISDISLGDFVTPTFVGSGALMSAVNPSVFITQTSTGQFAGSGVFDTTVYNTADIKVDVPHAKFTVTTEGLYQCVVCFSTSNVDGVFDTMLFHNGSPYQVGGRWFLDANGYTDTSLSPFGGQTGFIGQATFQIYLKPNDNVQAAFGWSNFGTGHGVSLGGNGSGSQTYFSIMRQVLT